MCPKKLFMDTITLIDAETLKLNCNQNGRFEEEIHVLHEITSLYKRIQR